MRIGLYFGSFNPIHVGHLLIAKHILNEHLVDQVWFVVSPQNPLKSTKGLLNEYQRHFMVQLALEGELNMKVSDIEFKLPRPSYTIDTMTYLVEKYPAHHYFIIIGSDSYVNLAKWKNSEVLCRDYQFIIYQRPGFEINHAVLPPNMQVTNAPLLGISSTLIRRLIKEKKSIRFMVPDKVYSELEQNGYYKK
jgi:nicotinate-nucleotide adenylyltransferase